MRFRRTLLATGMTAAAFAATGTTSAFALDCMNVSRPAPAAPTTPVADFYTDCVAANGGDASTCGPIIYVVQGNWWFTSFDGTFQGGFWDFVPPGTAASVLQMTAAQAASLGLPSAATTGNYQAGTGFGLLDKAQAPCITTRQTSHGIQAESMRCAG